MIQGIFASNQGIVGDRVGDFASTILQIDPAGTALMLALSSGMNKMSAADTTFTWYEDSHQSYRTQILSVGTGTTITVQDGTLYIPNDVLMVEDTGEYVIVEGTNGNDLTVSRGQAGTVIVAVSNTMYMQKVGNAHPEASQPPRAVTQQGAPRTNYTQIFRNSWAVSGTAKAVKYRTGNKVAKNKRDCAMYHAEDMERSMIWGRKAVGTRNGSPFRMTDGIVAQIEQYNGRIENPATRGVVGDYSQQDFADFIRRIFSKQIKGQPNERIAIGGDLVLQGLNQMTLLDSSYEIGSGEEVLGIKVCTYQTAFGKIKLLTHPLMNENPIWQRELYILHPGAIRKRMIRETEEENYDTKGNRITGVDADQGFITTEMGVEVGGASTMGILRNFQRAVPSKV